MAHTSIDTVLNSLVLNKIPSMENFKYMQENGLINENEVYFIKESKIQLILKIDEENYRGGGSEPYFAGSHTRFTVGQQYKIVFESEENGILMETVVTATHPSELTGNRIVLSDKNNLIYIYIVDAGDSTKVTLESPTVTLSRNLILQIYEL